MKNIAIVLSNICLSGGVQRVASLLANELVSKYDNVYIITFFQTNNISLKIDKKIKIINFYFEQKRIREIAFDYLKKLKDVIKIYDINVLIIEGRNNTFLPLLVKCCLVNIKIIFCEHNSIKHSSKINTNCKENIYLFISI